MLCKQNEESFHLTTQKCDSGLPDIAMANARKVDSICRDAFINVHCIWYATRCSREKHAYCLIHEYRKQGPIL